jgi:hypothetical protein
MLSPFTWTPLTENKRAHGFVRLGLVLLSTPFALRKRHSVMALLFAPKLVDAARSLMRSDESNRLLVVVSVTKGKLVKVKTEQDMNEVK